MSQQQSNPQTDIHPIIARRWSPRAFDDDRTVEPEALTTCLEAARWSSSCFGDEPWRFIVTDKSHNPEGWNKMLAILVEKNQLWAKHAPVLILACAAQNFSHNGSANRWGQYDTGQAMMSLALQATAVGLITHSMGGFDAALATTTFNIPDDFTPMSVTALGYLGQTESLDEGFRSIEMTERRRKPIHEIAFTSWNESWQAQERK